MHGQLLTQRACAPVLNKWCAAVMQISQDDEVDTKDPAIINFEKNMGFGSQTVLDNFRRFFK